MSTVGYVGKELLIYCSFLVGLRGNLFIVYTLVNGRRGLILVILHSSVDDCTKAREKVLESEVDLHFKKCLSTVQLHI